MYALARQRLICTGETAYRIGIIIMAAVVFYTLGMPIGKASETVGILKGYIQENSIKKEQSNALFLLKEKRMQEVKEKYKGYKLNVIEDGIVFVRMTKSVNSRRIKMNVAEIDKRINPDIEVIPKISAKNVHSRSSIGSLINKEETKIAVNGTYFMPRTGVPLGALVIDDEIISGPVYERAALLISEDNYNTARVGFKGSIKVRGEEINLDNINQPRMSVSHVIIYTPKWGSKAPYTKKSSKYIKVSGEKVVQKSDYPLDIPKDGYVINAPSDKVKGIETGDKIKANYGMTPNIRGIKHIISGGPYLLKSGEIYVDTAGEKLISIEGLNPRTAIGYTKDNVLIIVAIEGRKEGSSGVTIKELAKIMKDLGCYEAINLDGGSSTVMYVDGLVYKGTSSSYIPMISNALVVKRKA